MKTTTRMLPTHWAPALINGDLSGYDGEELEAIRLFTADMYRDHHRCWCIDVDAESPSFLTYHDARLYSVLACECSLFTFDVTPIEDNR